MSRWQVSPGSDHAVERVLALGLDFRVARANLVLGVPGPRFTAIKTAVEYALVNRVAGHVIHHSPCQLSGTDFSEQVTSIRDRLAPATLDPGRAGVAVVAALVLADAGV